MNVECKDLESMAKPLLEQLAILLEEFPQRLQVDVGTVSELIDNLTLSVSESPQWVLEAASFFGNGVIRISKKTVEYQWVFNYAYLAIYRKKFAGKMIGGEIRLDDDPDLTVPVAMLNWAQADVAAFGVASPPADFPAPDLEAEHGSLVEAASVLRLHSLRFHFFHEMAHLFFRTTGVVFDMKIDEERACDKKAIEWTMHFTPLVEDERDERYIYAGAAFALLILVAHGIDANYLDGVKHPRTYDRLVETLDQYFAPGADIVWGPVNAILGGHCSNQEWFVPQDDVPEDGFEFFREGVAAFRDLIHEKAELPPGPPI
jgi:hypothetical protein